MTLLKASSFDISDYSDYWKNLKGIAEPENIELNITISGSVIFFIFYDLFNKHNFEIAAKLIGNDVTHSQVFFKNFIKILEQSLRTTTFKNIFQQLLLTLFGWMYYELKRI